MPRNMFPILIICFLLISFSDSYAVEPEYLIGAGDVIRIFVWEESNLNISVPVRPDGRVTVPLVGEITVENKTSTEVSTFIKERLQSFIKTPTVTVIVSDIKSNVAYVIGGVKNPGEKQLTGKTTLLQFISKIGGFTEFAKISKAYIVRGDQKIDLKLKKLIKRNDLKYNIFIEKGDVMVVPQ